MSCRPCRRALPAVALVNVRRVVPSLSLSVRAAAARVPCFRLASGGPFVAPAFVPVLPPQASASPGSHSTAFAFGRPLSLGRATGVALVRRVSSSARRGRRIASADFHSTGVACGVGGFVSRGHCAATAPALSRILGALCVQPSRPNPPVNLAPFGRWTLRDEAAQRRLPARWGAESMRHFASSHIQPFALSPMRLVLPLRKVSALPSLPHARRFASACASCWRPLRGAPLEVSAQVRASRGQASACVGGHGSVVSLGRPLLLGRLARAKQIRRVPLVSASWSPYRQRRLLCHPGSVRRPCLRFSHPHCTLRAGAGASGARIAGEPQRPNPSLQGTLREKPRRPVNSNVGPHEHCRHRSRIFRHRVVGCASLALQRSPFVRCHRIVPLPARHWLAVHGSSTVPRNHGLLCCIRWHRVPCWPGPRQSLLLPRPSVRALAPSEERPWVSACSLRAWYGVLSLARLRSGGRQSRGCHVRHRHQEVSVNNPCGPTLRCRGRCAIKPRSAPALGRWASYLVPTDSCATHSRKK
jgi:hypothetical protein